jgi:uncharacterized membrane protein YdjX (TVP38/TMEM64 family)
MPSLKLSKPRTQFWILILIFAVLVGVAFLFDFNDKVWSDYFRRIPFPVAGALFVAAYIGMTFVFWLAAKDFLRIVGAVVFGPYWSTLFVWMGELGNAFIFFHMSRRLGRAYVEEKFHLKSGSLDRPGRRVGVWHIFLLRAFPIIPYRMLNLGYGLTSVSFRKYLIVSAVAMPFWLFWIQFILAAVGGSALDIPKLYTSLQQHMVLVRLTFLYLLVSTVVVILLRKKLE